MIEIRLAGTGERQFSRRLVAGEIVQAAEPGVQRADHAVSSALRPADAQKEVVIRVLPGPQRERFETEGIATFLGSPFRVSASSDRRGIRLEGPPIANRQTPDIPPEGTVRLSLGRARTKGNTDSLRSDDREGQAKDDSVRSG